MRIGGSVVGEDSQASLLRFIHNVHPVDDQVLLDFVPSLEEGIRVAAAAYIVGGVLVDRAVLDCDRKECLELPTAIVRRPARLGAPILLLDVPWIANPRVLGEGEAGLQVDAALSFDQR